jgi:hypothetical protein
MLESPSKLRRRWFQFSLGTLLVLVTVFAIWLGWELKFIRDRKNFLALLNEYEAAELKDGGFTAWINTPVFDEPTLPFWRPWMGDYPRGVVLLPGNTTEEHLQMARRLFPEAKYFAKGGVAIPNE